MTVFLGDKTSYDSSFKVNINFKGWRLIHVSLDHHMNLHIPGASKVATNNLKRIKFQAPDNIGNGRLHIDPIMITAYNAALLKLAPLAANIRTSARVLIELVATAGLGLIIF